MRNYREETDSEMDIWVFVTPEADKNKHLSMLMTPFRKICDPQDHFYRACEKKNRYKKIWVKSRRGITQQRLVRGFLYFGLLTFGSQFKLTN